MINRIRAARSEAADKGFTLIEMLIVIVVLGVLAGITVFGVAKFRDDASASACNADLKTVQVAADAYYAKTKNFPTAIADLLPSATVPDGYLKTTPSGTYTFTSATKTVSQAGCTL